MDALSDSKTIRVSPSETLSPTETAISMTVTPSALPVSGTDTNCGAPLVSPTDASAGAAGSGFSAAFSVTDSAPSSSQIGSPSLTSAPSDT